MYDIAAMIKAVSDMINGVFNFKTEKVKNASTIEVLSDKERQEKAIYHAEKAIEIMRDYLQLIPKSKRIKLKHHINGFNKYD